MQQRAVRIGPVAMAASATNIANSAITSLAGPVGYTQTQPYLLLTHIRIVNKTAGAVNASLFIGATGGSAAGTEFGYSAYSIAANSFVDWYGRVRLESTDFLTGLASAATSLTFEGEGEIGLT
jgi:hypothetical protein